MGTPLSPVELASAFRVLLDCMARPGRIGTLSGAGSMDGLHDSTMAIIHVLVDQSAPLHLAPELATAGVLQNIRFATGAAIAPDPAAASFVVTPAARAAEMLPALRLGTPEFPDRSATLIVQCTAIGAEGGVVLSGPGIAHEHGFVAAGTDREFWQTLSAMNRQSFPMGVDVFFTAPGAVAAIARSTRIGGF